jgi:DNA invertase Pin-like site-specific DNA recombinase
VSIHEATGTLAEGNSSPTPSVGQERQERLLFSLPYALAESERRLIQERTNAGLAAARARGRKGGRKAMPVNVRRVQTTKALHADKDMPVPALCRTLNISRSTLYRWLAMN